MLEEFFDQYAERYRFSKANDGWCYEDGCVYRGLQELARTTGKRIWLDHLKRLIASQISEDGTLRGYSPDEYNIDYILSGRVLFALSTEPGDRFDLAMELLASQLAQHPRTDSGSYWHKQIYPNQVWLDGLYMGLPYQIEYGLLRGRPDLVDDAAAQILRALSLMQDEATGLYIHGHDHSRKVDWCDPETGLSKSLWGRANGWLAMALVDAYELLPADHEARAELAARILALSDAILRQRTPNGLWLQVMDRPDLAGNYEETSCSSMFAYFFLKIARLIEGGEHLVEEGINTIVALENHHIRNIDGVWQLDNVCEVAGLGGPFGKVRDGTPDYYLSEPVVANDPKAVGPLMMAYAESIRAGNAESLPAGQEERANRTA